ncbi:MAG: hypothetical protein PHW03_01225 [Eubacteriales bacterium]|nr:hypothetical protein [Eubacteriales bacterium]MDD4389405.1 hypothetical protein [Eubacteriales bacterium]
MFKSKNVTSKILKLSGLLVLIGAIAVGIMTGSSYVPLYPFSIVFFSGLMTAAPGLIGAVALYALGEIIDLMQNIKDKVAPVEKKNVSEDAEGNIENDAIEESDEEVADESAQAEK